MVDLRGCQPTEPPARGYGPPKATVSCARPLSPAMEPSQDFRPAATACRERHQMDTIQKKNNQERALHTSDTTDECELCSETRETVSEQLLNKKTVKCLLESLSAAEMYL